MDHPIDATQAIWFESKHHQKRRFPDKEDKYLGSPHCRHAMNIDDKLLLRERLNGLSRLKLASPHMKTMQKSSLKLMTAIAVSALSVIALDTAYAQSTSSSIGGKAPADSTITVHSDSGLTRQSTAKDNGRYRFPGLVPGTYLVSLEKDGKTVAQVQGVPLFASRASEVDFACDNGQCTGSFR